MRYLSVKEGRFIARPNRFIAEVEIDGEAQRVHVKNTGRCKELLLPGATVYLERSATEGRKTPYDLIAVIKPPYLINMDSQVPNAVVAEWLAKGNLFSKNAVIKREVTYKNSRFDIYVEDGERRAFIEVKGVTLENDGIAYFPDAPTLRGVKHITELSRAVSDGYEAYVFFLVQMSGVKEFRPNYATHAALGEALCRASAGGVGVIAYDCVVKPDSIEINSPVEVCLEKQI